MGLADQEIPAAINNHRRHVRHRRRRGRAAIALRRQQVGKLAGAGDQTHRAVDRAPQHRVAVAVADVEIADAVEGERCLVAGRDAGAELGQRRDHR